MIEDEEELNRLIDNIILYATERERDRMRGAYLSIASWHIENNRQKIIEMFTKPKKEKTDEGQYYGTSSATPYN